MKIAKEAVGYTILVSLLFSILVGSLFIRLKQTKDERVDCDLSGGTYSLFEGYCNIPPLQQRVNELEERMNELEGND